MMMKLRLLETSLPPPSSRTPQSWLPFRYSNGASSCSAPSTISSNPGILLTSPLQGKLGAMCGTASGYVASLPAPVRRRIKALKKLQLEATKIEAKFYEEVI